MLADEWIAQPTSFYQKNFLQYPSKNKSKEILDFLSRVKLDPENASA